MYLKLSEDSSENVQLYTYTWYTGRPSISQAGGCLKGERKAMIILNREADVFHRVNGIKES